MGPGVIRDPDDDDDKDDDDLDDLEDLDDLDDEALDPDDDSDDDDATDSADVRQAQAAIESTFDEVTRIAGRYGARLPVPRAQLSSIA